MAKVQIWSIELLAACNKCIYAGEMATKAISIRRYFGAVVSALALFRIRIIIGSPTSFFINYISVECDAMPKQHFFKMSKSTQARCWLRSAHRHIRYKWFHSLLESPLQKSPTLTPPPPPPSSWHTRCAFSVSLLAMKRFASIRSCNLRDMTNAFITATKTPKRSGEKEEQKNIYMRRRKNKRSGKKTASRLLLAKVWEQMLLECLVLCVRNVFLFTFYIYKNCTFRCAFRMCAHQDGSLFVQIRDGKRRETIQISRDWK